MNFEKSLIYFGANVQDGEKEAIVNQLRVRVASNPEKWAFANYVDRFRKRVDGWSVRYLSMREGGFH